MTVLSICLLVVLLVGLVQVMASEREYFTDLQISSVESGFEKVWHTSFIASPFFFMATLFVLFDVELMLLFPLLLGSTKTSFLVLWGMTMLLFIIILTLGMEWVYSGLKWAL